MFLLLHFDLDVLSGNIHPDLKKPPSKTIPKSVIVFPQGNACNKQKKMASVRLEKNHVDVLFLTGCAKSSTIILNAEYAVTLN